MRVGRVPELSVHAESSHHFCDAFRIVGRDQAGHHGAVLTSKASFFSRVFGFNSNANGAMMALTLCRDLVLLAVRCEQQSKQVVIAADPSGIDDTYCESNV